MTIRHLKTFIAVCEHSGITKAAEALHIAQPAVSQTIAELEKYYNVILFDRISQRLILTEYGKQLLMKAKETVSSFDDFESLASENRLNTNIHIGSSLTIGKQFIPTMLIRLKEQYPQIQTTVVIDSAAVIEENLIKGYLDFAFVEGNIKTDILKAQVIAHDRLIAVCSMHFAAAENITLNELAQYPMLLREKGSASRDYLDGVLSSNGLTVNPVVESASNQALIACAEKNLGIAVLPHNIVEEYLKTKRLRTITIKDCNFDRLYYYVRHKNKRFSAFQEQAVLLCNSVFEID